MKNTSNGSIHSCRIEFIMPGSLAVLVAMLAVNYTLSQDMQPIKDKLPREQVLKLEKEADSLLLYANYRQAINAYHRLLTTTQNLPDKRHYNRTLNRLTDVYIETDTILKATRYCQMVLDSSEKYLPANDPEIAYAYKNMGEIYNRRGIGKQAFENLFKTVDIMLEGKHDDHPYLAYIYSDLAYEYDVAWEFNQAIAYHLKALSIIRKYFPEDHPVTASFINQVGDCYYGNNDFKTANIWHKKSLGIFLKSFDENHPAVGENLMDIGKNFLFLRVQDSSAFYLHKALPVLKHTYPEHHRIICHYYEVMGYFNYTFQKHPIHISNMEKSLFLLKQRDVFHHRKISWVCGWLGNLFNHSFYLGGNSDPSLLDSAFRYNWEGINALVPEFVDTNRYVNPPIDNPVNSKSLLNILRDKAILYRTAYENYSGDVKNLKAYFETNSLLIRLATKINDERQSLESRSAVLDEIYHFVNRAVISGFDYYLASGDKDYIDSAFYFSEKNKSRLLMSVMSRETAMRHSGVPDSLLDKEKAISDGISRIENELLKIRPAALPYQDKHTETLQDSLFDLKYRQTLLFCALQTHYPDFYHQYFNQEPVNMIQLQETLAESEAIIAYSMINFIRGWPGRITCFAITKDTIVAFTTGVENKIDSALKAFCSFVNSNTHLNAGIEEKENFVKACYFLYSKLLEPAEKFIHDKILIIIPDGDLYKLPFEILLTQSNEISPVNFQKLPYLIRDHSISYANSASIFFTSRSVKREPDHKASLLAMAPSFDPGNSFTDPLVNEWIERGENFGELKGAQEEIGFIHKLGGGLSLTGKDATEQAFRRKAPDYKILHIATHGLIDDRYPMQSKLIFYHDTTQADDGLLNVYELYSMNLNAQLVVLSACNTGFGTFKKGEGVVSLARGFAYAGVPSVVMSLWKVSDRSTAKLMKYFYTYLKEGYPKDKALQLAKLKYLEQSDPFYSNPYFWAGFVQIGDTVPVEFEKRNQLIWILPFVFLATIIAVLSWRFIKR